MFIRGLFVCLLLLSGKATAEAQSSWELLSDVGAYGLVTTAFVVPVIHKDWEGVQQTALSIGTAGGIGLISKSLIDAERPDKSNNNSFPSNHSASAFSAATNLHIRYGWKYGFPAYGVAGLVAIGRVEADKHYWQDVIAGAVIGIGSAWIFTEKLDSNIQFLPSLSHNSMALTINYRW